MSSKKQEELEKRKREHERALFRERLFVQIELIIWMVFAGIIGWQWYYRLDYKANQFDLINIVLFSSSMIIVPLLFRTVFGLLPLQYLRQNVRVKNKNLTQTESDEIDEDAIRHDELKYQGPEDYLVNLCISSEKLSRKIFSRSSSYLFIGSFIASVGIIYFSFQSIEIVQGDKSGTEMIVLFLPRFGALFFIEFVAFFFLKQYRITMDEFKYYESLKRQRESNLLMLKIQLDKTLNKEKEMLKSILDRLELFSNPTILKENETTENIETRKYSNEELNILNNVVNQIGNLKKS